MRRRAYTLVVAAVAAVIGALALGTTPALASGSTIDIGYTIEDHGYVKGSGSDYNTGDYTNVCVAIMERTGAATPWNPYDTVSVSCRSNRGHNWWSAPDVNWSTYVGFGQCGNFYTRITAYHNGSQVANKNSNVIAQCNN